MSDLPVETTPGVAAPAHEAARGQIVYITEHGERVAAIVPAAVAAELERLSPGELAELLEDFADAAAAREARASIDAGEPLIPGIRSRRKLACSQWFINSSSATRRVRHSSGLTARSASKWDA